MNKIVLKNFVLEQFNYENIEHLRMIDKFDMDREINKYIIMSDDSFSDIVDYYRQFNDDSIYDKLYLVRNLENEIIGSLELDGKENDLYINYSILSDYRNKGYCTNLLRQISKLLLLEVKKISLLIKKDNEKSKHLALNAGYSKMSYENLGYYKYQIKFVNF